MDLSFSFDHDAELVVWPSDLAVLMTGIAARQMASPTALAQAAGAASGSAAASPFAPADGCFNGAVAAALTHWKDE